MGRNLMCVPRSIHLLIKDASGEWDMIRFICIPWWQITFYPQINCWYTSNKQYYSGHWSYRRILFKHLTKNSDHYIIWQMTSFFPLGSLFCRLIMMTSSNRNIFRVTGHLCGEFTGEFPAQRPVTRSFDVFFDLRLNRRLSKQSWCWWFETLSRPLWRHRNDRMGLLPRFSFI